MSPRIILTVTALLAAAASGCATQGPQPTEQITRARAVVEQADKGGAQRYAAADLQRAHDELADADKANSAKRYDEARSSYSNARLWLARHGTDPLER